MRTPCLFALWCTAMVTFVGLALDHDGSRADRLPTELGGPAFLMFNDLLSRGRHGLFLQLPSTGWRKLAGCHDL